jgi:hypothetical protein
MKSQEVEINEISPEDQAFEKFDEEYKKKKV